MAGFGRPVPPAKVQLGKNAPMAPTRGTTSPQDLDKRTTATKPVGKSMGKPRGFGGGGRY